MRQLKHPHNFSLPPRRRTVESLGVFKLSKTKPLWRKAPFYVRWFPAIIFLAVFLLTLAALSHASPPDSRGARPIALGNGYVGVSGDVYSLHYNPAGLYEMNQQE